MTQQRYSKQESLNRILRALTDPLNYSDSMVTSQGEGVLSGEIYSEDEALSRITEVIQATLDGQTGYVPYGLNLSLWSTSPNSIWQGSGTYTSGQESLVSPMWLDLSQGYGGIYVHTGTVMMQPATGAWRKITGSFQNDMYSRNCTPDWNDDRILVSLFGHYFVNYTVSFIGSPATDYGFSVHVQNTAQPSADSIGRPSASGSAMSVSGYGVVYISGSNQAVDLRVSPSQTAFFKVLSAQLVIRRLTS